ncbi:hypothetical protein [Prevotella sp. 10(H)]|uniref:hypothetical protein n=1 Tax=Prevotella sp. 10(H) TaxID=1158294 RepID=UPI0004A7373E|nr:hypothetical protein [Prevotella sp. 10(H)]
MAIDLSPLISGQTIRIDNHRYDTKFDGLHVHKIMNNNYYNGAEILIPIDTDYRLTFRKLKGKKKLIKEKIQSEINNAFKKDEKATHKFVKEILSGIEMYSFDMTKQERILSLIRFAKSLATVFKLPKYLDSFVRKEIDGKIKSYISEFKDEYGKSTYIFQDIDNKEIIIGKNLNIIENWDDIINKFESYKS